MTEAERIAKSRAYHRAYAEANRERIRQNKAKWRASLTSNKEQRIPKEKVTTLKIRTETGGWKHDVSTSWNSKLVEKKIRKTQFVNAERLYREIDEGFRYFFNKRRMALPYGALKQ